jgi:outer membrane receptor protein involved in Fe transport
VSQAETATAAAEEFPSAEADRPQDDPVDPIDSGLEERVVVAATRSEQDPFEVPRAITAVGRARIEARSPLSLLDAVDDQVGVWVEKRTTTTSDPVVRGLSGGNLLALVGQNTLSTFWGEGGFAGDDMYGKVDPDSVERIEIVRGPSSVLYGSNALGGVINFVLRDAPLDFTARGWEMGGRLKAGAASAADEFRSRAEIFGASPTVRYLLGLSRRDAGDLRAGGDVGTQDPTSGEELNLDASLQWRTSEHSFVNVKVQNVHRENIHRFYRPTQDNENYRKAVAAGFEQELQGQFLALYKVDFYYQDKEDRRRFFESGNLGIAKWETYSADVRAVARPTSDHELIGGIAWHRDYGESPDDEQFTIITPDGSRTKPAPDSTWDSVGLYLHDRWSIGERWLVTMGVRYDWFRFDADPDEFYQAGIGDPTLDEFTSEEEALVGGLGVMYVLRPGWRAYADYARGFRMFPPNFGVRQLGFGVLVPNQLLDPVTADNVELGAKWRRTAGEGSVALYYTDFHDFQNVVESRFLGQDWYDINGDGIRQAQEKVFQVQGSGDAYVYGIEIESSLKLSRLMPSLFGPGWNLYLGFMWNYGNDETNDVPFRHTHPARGLFRLRWDAPRSRFDWWWEIGADFVREYDRIPPSRIGSDPSYFADPQDPGSGLIRPDGHLPGYTVYDARGGLRLAENVGITAGIDNATDKLYRPAHSRMDASGFNAYLSVDYWF